MSVLKSITVGEQELYLGDNIYKIDEYGKHIRKLTFVSEFSFEWSSGWGRVSELTINKDLKSRVKFIFNTL